MDEESIVRICVTAFSDKDIEDGKRLLFKSVKTQKRRIGRRKEGKSQRDVEDIIQLFKVTEPDQTPIFVARKLNCLPPISFDHLDATNLLKDILILKNDLRTIKESYVITSQLEQTREEMCGVKNFVSTVNRDYNNVNKRRGAAFMESFMYDSGPMGLHHLSQDSHNIPQHSEYGNPSKPYTETLNINLPSRKVSLPSSANKNSKNAHTMEQQADCVEHVESATENTQDVRRPTGVKEIDREVSGAQNTEQICVAPIVVNQGADGVMPKCDNRSIMEQPWQEVIIKKSVRKQNLFNGRIGKASENHRVNFKAAQTKIPLFMGMAKNNCTFCIIISVKICNVSKK